MLVFLPEKSLPSVLRQPDCLQVFSMPVVVYNILYVVVLSLIQLLCLKAHPMNSSCVSPEINHIEFIFNEAITTYLNLEVQNIFEGLNIVSGKF